MRIARLTDLEMWADRIHAMGVAESIELQLEMDVLISVARSREALTNMNSQLKKVLHQVYYLDQLLTDTEVSYRNERKINLELQMDNRRLLEENACLAREIRQVKGELNKLMSNGKF